MKPRLLVDGDLTLSSGATTLHVRGAGDRLEIHFDRWLDLLKLRTQRPYARFVRDAGFGIDVRVRGVRIPSWITS